MKPNKLYFRSAGDLLNAVPAFKRALGTTFYISCNREYFSLVSDVCNNVEYVGHTCDVGFVDISQALWHCLDFAELPLHVVIGNLLGIQVPFDASLEYKVESSYSVEHINALAVPACRIGVHLEAGGADRSLSLDVRAEIVEGLVRDYPEAQIFVFGSETLPKKDLQNVFVLNDLSLKDQIVTFMYYMDYAICVDSLFNQLASLFGKPTLSLFTLIHPMTRRHGNVLDIYKDLRCCPCQGYQKCSELLCKHKITSERVLEEFRRMMGPVPLVDVIIPTWNTKDITIRCVKHLLEYSYYPIRIFIVDNASTDGTSKELEKQFFGMSNLIIHTSHKNLGWVGGINKGMEIREQMGNNKYVVWMNSDVMVTNGWLPRMMQHFENSDYEALGPKSDYVMGKQNVGSFPRKLESSADFNWFADKRWIGNYHRSVDAKLLIGFFIMMKQEAVEKVGILDEGTFGTGFSDDLDWSIRANEVGVKLGITENVFVHHIGNVSFAKARASYGEKGDAVYQQQLKVKDGLLREKWGNEKVNNLFVENPSLALCLIARDEATILRRSVEPFKKIAKQIIIGVDDRSTDNTYQIAKKLGTDVFKFKFENFAQARNLTLAKVRCGWMLWMDADDYFDVRAIGEISNILAEDSNGKLLPYAFAFPTALIENGKVANQNVRVRLVRLGRGYHWEHYVHENLTLRGDDFAVADIVVHHGVLRPSRKGLREYELELAKQEFRDFPTDMMVMLNLARTTEALEEFQDAEEIYQRILSRSSGHGDLVFISCLQIGHMLLKAGRSLEALDYAHKALRCAVMRAESWSLLGLCYMEIKHYAQAEFCFRSAINCVIRWSGTMPVDPGLYNWKSLSNLSAVYILQGRFEEAVKVLEQAREYNPNDDAIKTNLNIARVKAQSLRPVALQIVSGVTVSSTS